MSSAQIKNSTLMGSVYEKIPTLMGLSQGMNLLLQAQPSGRAQPLQTRPGKEPTTVGSTQRKSSALMCSVIFWILFSLHLQVYKKSLKSLLYFHRINVCVRNIYPLLMLSGPKKNIPALTHHKRTRLIGYKYSINPSSVRFTIYLFFIFSI